MLLISHLEWFIKKYVNFKIVSVFEVVGHGTGRVLELFIFQGMVSFEPCVVKIDVRVRAVTHLLNVLFFLFCFSQMSSQRSFQTQSCSFRRMKMSRGEWRAGRCIWVNGVSLSLPPPIGCDGEPKMDNGRSRGPLLRFRWFSLPRLMKIVRRGFYNMCLWIKYRFELFPCAQGKRLF